MEQTLLLVELQKAWSKEAREAALAARTRARKLPFNDPRYTPLDRRLIDIKKDRPLNDPKKVMNIQRVLPGAQFVVPYSKTPFFDKLNKLQGTPHPKGMAGEDYAKAREKLFAKQPTERLKISSLIFTQTVVNTDKIRQGIDEPKSHPAYVVRYQGKNYLMDGHHNTVSRVFRGKSKVKAHVLDIK